MQRTLQITRQLSKALRITSGPSLPTATVSRARGMSAAAAPPPPATDVATAEEEVDPEAKFGAKKSLKADEPRPLYLDAQSTTPLDPRVLDAMLPYMTSYYGNPHSRTHAYGWESEAAMETARQQVADLINADPKEIVFTSGATESNNISVKGVARYYQ